MNEIKKIQKTIIKNLKKLDEENIDIATEISRSNAISTLANTYIKSCNLIIRIEEAKDPKKIRDLIG